MTFNEKPIYLAGIDTGKHKTFAALVGLQCYPKANFVFIDYAQKWPLKTEYIKVVSDIKKLQTKMRYQSIGLEINNAGTAVHELMTLAKLPVVPLTTVGKITDPAKLEDSNYMRYKVSKVLMPKYILRLKQQHKIKWPDKPKNQYIRELLTQFSLFKQNVTDAGNETFSAPGGAYDDLVLAFFMAMKLAQKWIRIVEPNHFIRNIPAWEASDPIEQEMQVYA